jgi:hypothetical protein
MNQQVSISTALCLFAPDIEALIQGRIIAALPKIFIRPGQQFALYSTDSFNCPIYYKQYYRSNFLSTAQDIINQFDATQVLLKAWARCELCQILNMNTSLEILSQLTIWTTEGLQEILRQRQHIFLAYLRVYKFPESEKVTINLIRRGY